jgi:hypothetical protein
MLHITQTDRDIDRHLSLSLSLYIVLVLVACTLSHHHHHHTTRAVRVYVCVCVCIWLPFEQCFRRPDNRPHNDNNHAEDKQQAHTAPLKRTTPRPIRGGAWRVVCVCIGVSCCEAAVRGGRVEIRAVPPPPACCHKSSRQACRRQARTFPPCCCCCCNINTMNDCAMRTLYDAHHWCAAARWPAHQAPRTRTRTHMCACVRAGDRCTGARRLHADHCVCV